MSLGAPRVHFRLVDDREYEAQRKFDQLRSEMTGRAMAASLARHDGGES